MKFCIILPLLFLSFSPIKAEEVDAVTKGSPRIKQSEQVEIKRVTTDKKILVVYYSRSGNTEVVAEQISGILGADIEKIIDKKEKSGFLFFISATLDSLFKKTPKIDNIKNDPSKYDLVVVGTPVWFYTMTPTVRTYLTDNKDKFKKVAFFTIADATKPEKPVKKMEKVIGKKCAGFTGFDKHQIVDKKIYNKKLTEFIDKIK